MQFVDFYSVSFGDRELKLIEDKLEMVTHIEYDKYIPGNILFTSGAALYTKNLSNDAPSALIIGQSAPLRSPESTRYRDGNRSVALFSQLFGFTQLSSFEVVVTDSANGVLRLIDRRSVETSLFAGKVGNHQPLVEGNFSHCQFTYPFGITRYDNTTLIVSDSDSRASPVQNRTLCILDMSTPKGDVRCFQFNNTFLTKILIHPIYGILVSLNSDIRQFNVTNYSWSNDSFIEADDSLIAHSLLTYDPTNPFNYTDGSLSEATYGLLFDSIFLNNQTMMVADVTAQRLRVIDFNGKNVTSICSGQYRPLSEGNIRECRCVPLSLMIIDSSTVLVGVIGGLMTLSSK